MHRLIHPRPRGQDQKIMKYQFHVKLRKSELWKIVLSLVIFVLSIPFTMLSDDRVFGNLSLFAVWLTFIATMESEKFFARFYYLLFGVFFVIPPAIAGDINFLVFGQFFRNIHLSTIDVIKMQAAIFIFLAIFPVATLFFQVRQRARTSSRIMQLKQEPIFYATLAISFIIIIIFNLQEAAAVYSQGYYVYFTGELEVQKGLSVLASEYAFIILSILGISSKKALPPILLLIYAASSVLAGQRMPGAMLVILIAAAAYPEGQLRRRFLIFSALGFGVAPPLMMIVQTLRAAGVDGLASVSIGYFFVDFWAVIGHSLDTLKAAIISDNTRVEDINLFARLNLTLNVVFSRVFGVELGLSVNGFGAAFSQYFGPDLFFERRVTFASSGIAESYFVLGLVGVGFYAALAAGVCAYFQGKMDFLHPFSLLILFVFGPKFLVGVRNELFGWIFEGALYFITMYPLYRLLKWLFVKRTALAYLPERYVGLKSPQYG